MDETAPLALVRRGEGPGVRGISSVVQLCNFQVIGVLLSFQDRELQVNRAPHPFPLSPEYQGEGNSFSDVSVFF